ncbi:hypothetical protein BC833DRAFT_621221 [Globomyces pollinis-pini]|nr:hypothetical protein BC833DRAFT_621221 [Globomyces pollinis-pini]
MGQSQSFSIGDFPLQVQLENFAWVESKFTYDLVQLYKITKERKAISDYVIKLDNAEETFKSIGGGLFVDDKRTLLDSNDQPICNLKGNSIYSGMESKKRLATMIALKKSKLLFTLKFHSKEIPYKISEFHCQLNKGHTQAVIYVIHDKKCIPIANFLRLRMDQLDHITMTISPGIDTSLLIMFCIAINEELDR